METLNLYDNLGKPLNETIERGKKPKEGNIMLSVIFIMKKARSAGLGPVIRAVWLLLMFCEFWPGVDCLGNFLFIGVLVGGKNFLHQ